MKNRRYSIFLMILLIHQFSLPKFNMKEMFEGMGTSFGAPPAGYTYSFEVLSDASRPIFIEQQSLVSFMGAYFPGDRGYYGHQKIPSIFEATEGTNRAGHTDSKYYFNLFIGTSANAHKNKIYKQSLTQLPLKKNDPNVYYYHVYTSGGFSKGRSTHESEVEMMGYQNPKELNNPDSTKKGSVAFTTQLSDISFYNSSGTDVQVSLKYGTEDYTCTLEKYSYNSLSVPPAEAKKSSSAQTSVTALSSDVSTPQELGLNSVKTDDVVTQGARISSAPVVASQPQSKSATSIKNSMKKVEDEATPPFSLRPNTLSFASYDAATKKYVPFRSFYLQSKGFEGGPCTIEIFQDPGKELEVGMQGLNPGNYDLPVTPRVRDLTPCPCTFWYQSFEQGGSIEGYSNLPGQMWVVYAGADSPIQAKVIPGQAVGWDLVRPLVDQGDQYVYFVYVATADDQVAQKFVTKLAARIVGENVVDQYEKIVNSPVVLSSTNQNLDITDNSGAHVKESLTPDQQVAALMGNLQISQGVIEDLDQGIIGYIVGADVFTPKGLGFGKFHYVLAPSVISMNNLVSLLQGSLDSSKTADLGGSDANVQSSLNGKVNDWFIVYMKNPAEVRDQVERFLMKYGNAKIVDAATGSLTKFGQFRLQDILTGSNSLKFPSMKLSTVTNQYVYDFGKSAPDKMPKPIKISQNFAHDEANPVL